MPEDRRELEKWDKLPKRLVGSSSNPIISKLNDALDRRERVRITYLKGSDPGQPREITPKEIYERDGFCYVDAYCHERRAERCFRVDRIRMAGLGSRNPTRNYKLSGESRKYTERTPVSRQPATDLPHSLSRSETSIRASPVVSSTDRRSRNNPSVSRQGAGSGKQGCLGLVACVSVLIVALKVFLT